MTFLNLTRIVVVSTILLLSACSTTVRTSKKAADANTKFTSVAVLWHSNKDLKFEIRKNGNNLFKPTITDDERAAAETNLRALYQHLAANASTALAEELRAEHVTVTQLPNEATRRPRDVQTQLRIVPVFAGTECSPPVCSNDIGLQVIATEGAENKQLWYGDFKVGAPWGGTSVDKLSSSFASGVIRELKKQGLL